MNKEELIKKYKDEFSSIGMNLSTTIKFKELWIDILELDEPQKVKVPQFVADFIERERRSGGDLEDLFSDIVYEQYHLEWFREEKNMNLVARAWLDGYEVEKEKRYRVSLKNGQPLLKAFLGEALYFSQDIAIERYEVTRKQLEEAGFGEVFNCPLFEVEEVEE